MANALVGRASELAALERSLSAAMAGRTTVVLVGGDPGVGKTRLMDAAAARATEVGAAVGWGVSPATGASPFLPWRAALRTTVAPARALLDGGGGGSGDARFRVFERVVDEVVTASRERTVVIVLDDLQWADPGSLELLRFLARTLHGAPVLVLGTYRHTEAGAGSPLADVLEDLGSCGEHLRLQGLPPADVAVLAAHLGADADPEALHERTAGNPFLVAQLCDSAMATGADVRVAPLPAAAAALVGHRLHRLRVPCRSVLDVAAVAGRVVDLRLLAAALGRDPASLLPVIDEALAAQIVEASPGRPPTYRFVHDLVREALVDALPAERLARLHWHLGEVLASWPRRSEEAARHLQAGLLAGDPERAVAASLQAAEDALDALAFEQAAEHLAWVVDARGDEVDVELLLGLGEARLRAGDWDSAGTAYEQAARQARRADDAEGLARAALGFGAGLAGFEVRLLDPRQISLLEEAATALRGSSSPLLSFVLARLSVAVSFVDDSDRRQELSQRAVEHAEASGDPAAMAYALATRADVLAGPDHVEERIALASRIVELARAAGDDELRLLGHRFRVVALLEAGDVAAVDREIAAFTSLAEWYRLPVVRWYVPLFAGMRALMQGDVAAARRLADEAQAIGAQAGSVNASMLAGTLRMAIAREEGTVAAYAAQVRAMVEPYIERNATMASPYATLAAVELAAGNVSAAQHAFDGLARLDFGAEQRDSEWLGTLEAAADLCVAMGDSVRGRRVYDLLLPYAGRFIVDGIGAACLAVVDEVLARLALLLAEPVAARHHLETALETYDRTASTLLHQRARRLLEPRAPAVATPQSGAFARDGDVWVISYAGREVRVRDAKGLHDLATLLKEPGRHVHVAELTGAGMLSGPVDVVLDDRAKREFRQRLRSLDEDLADAERDGDGERYARARVEREALVDALAEATGLAGRDRGVAATDLDRARQAVRARIRHVLQRLEGVHPELARHLSVSVRTGLTCVYLPDREVRWRT